MLCSLVCLRKASRRAKTSCLSFSFSFCISKILDTIFFICRSTRKSRDTSRASGNLNRRFYFLIHAAARILLRGIFIIDSEKNKYNYHYTDHLGNVCLNNTNSGSGVEIIEESNYYPFDLKQKGIILQLVRWQ